jgi:hypothetical protein
MPHLTPDLVKRWGFADGLLGASQRPISGKDHFRSLYLKAYAEGEKFREPIITTKIAKRTPKQARTITHTHRNSRQILGVRFQLQGEVNVNRDGAYVTTYIKTARNLLEICEQLIQMKEDLANDGSPRT